LFFNRQPELGCRQLNQQSAIHKVHPKSDSSRDPVVGAAPEGAHDADSASRAVREMFTSIAPRYDLLNHVLSFNVDRIWWRRAARTFAAILARPDACVLDLCCGTGDMTFALADEAAANPKNTVGVADAPSTMSSRRERQLSEGPDDAHPSVPPPASSARDARSANEPGVATKTQILGADFSHAMLQRARAKSLNQSLHRTTPRWIEADALRLPFPSGRFDLVTSAFGFRNLVDYDAGLREIVRVLRPGGECGILDFSEPRGLIGHLYRFYFKQILPRIGTMISGVRGPYAYLPASVERFPAPEEMLTRMRHAGFGETTWTPYTFGIAGLYRGKK
jgi:demethylmenaquinone methyltransferase / 2-methoxy-6-polyprenyl-1,4-benzoquinol methylase